MKNIRPGQILIEIVLAIGIAVMALLSVSRMSSRSVSNAGSATRQSAATNYAQNALGMIKGMVTANLTAAKTDPLYVNLATWCFDGGVINTAKGTGFCPIAGTEFSGRVSMARATPSGKDELTIVSEIQWTEGNLNRQVTNEYKIVLDQ